MRYLFTALAMWAVSATAQAHAFIQPYKLPMPYWMYIYGAVAALLLSFVVLALFMGRSSVQAASEKWFGDAVVLSFARRIRLKLLLQITTVLLLVLSIVSGFIGNQDSSRNINMTLFWVMFTLGFSYFVALFGNWYAMLNPWQSLVRWGSALLPILETGRWRYPRRWAYWPAVILYMGFIWIELLGSTRPFSLSLWLLIYSVINVVGVLCWGRRDWFQYGEFFAVFMRLLALCSPIHYDPDAAGKKRWGLRWPFAGLLSASRVELSLTVFILFMLSSTAFDGLRETKQWFAWFWYDPYGWIEALIDQKPVYAYAQLRPWYIGYETVVLLLSPFLYLGLFALFLWLGQRLTKSVLTLPQLLSTFALSLVPIAVVYHATHYYTLLLTQGVKIRGLFSDPFGWGWDLFGTFYAMRMPIIPDMGKVWNSQVFLILAGHVASVAVAHMLALRVFPQARSASWSQLPMLLLMMAFTASGLWILAQPLQGR
jgi:hypothetical protein